MTAFFPKIIPGDVIKMHPEAIKDLIADGLVEATEAGELVLAEGVEIVVEGAETLIQVGTTVYEYAEEVIEFIIEVIDASV